MRWDPLLKHRYSSTLMTSLSMQSSRSEEFYDVQLNVKGMVTLERAFQDYIETETMNGENQYAAEGKRG
jgi:ubiquitin carboxyl-terminal hydrolase 7